MGAVENQQFWMTGSVAEGPLVDLGGEARTPHSQQYNVAKTSVLDILGQRLHGRQLAAHGLVKGQPPETVGQLWPGLGRPEGRVLGPQPASEVFSVPAFQPFPHDREVTAEFQ